MGCSLSLVVSLVITIAPLVVTAASPTPASAGNDLTRIQLVSHQQLQFFATVSLGSSPRRFRVLLDTGSSDLWVARDVSALSDPNIGSAFRIQYGSGAVAGVTTCQELHLGGDNGDGDGDGQTSTLVLADVCVGLVHQQTKGLQTAGLEGVIGLGMEALAQLNTNRSFLSSLVHQQLPNAAAVFSLHLNRWPGERPPSQLIVGGVDEALADTNTTWIRFPVISHSERHQTSIQAPPDSAHYGFWALGLRALLFDNRELPLVFSTTIPRADGVQAIALLDSGTALLLLPAHAYHAVAQELLRRFGARLTPSTAHSCLLRCRRCQVHEFPSLAFDLWLEGTDSLDATSQRLELQASDYVRCDQHRRECTVLVDMTRVASAISGSHTVVVLGTVFFRAYYTSFDYTRKEVAIACSLGTDGVCSGRHNPLLDAEGRPQSPYFGAGHTRPGLFGIYAATTAIAVFFGFRALVEPRFKPSRVLGKAEGRRAKLLD